MSNVKQLQFFSGGKWITSQSEKYMDVFNPNTGEVLAKTPCCTESEVEGAILAASKAFPSWSALPSSKRAAILFNFRKLLEENIDALTLSVCQENGKVWDEAMGDVLKAKEGTEFACSIPTLLMGEALLDVTTGHDTALYKEPIGVFAGLAPFNFPAMIPFGWMAPLCLAAGNTMVLKASSMTPMTAFMCGKLMQEAGLPDGVLNIVTANRGEAEILIKHPLVKGISFVGSTAVGKHIYATGAAHGKRVQALCEAKNHALVLADAQLERTARSIINAAFGCAGERCMALPVVVAHNDIADELSALLVKFAGELKVGPAYDKSSQMGPVVTSGHKKFVTDWIDKGVAEGAKLLIDGRQKTVQNFENGFYIGPTIFDHVTPDMTIGNQEVFGPVLCIKRVNSFEEGLQLMNNNPFANGSVIFTQSGYFGREFAKRTHGGMVGINVAIPVPMGIFPFTGHKDSFFGDLHCLGKDGVRFFTETKAVTTKWFDIDDVKAQAVSTWDGVM